MSRVHRKLPSRTARGFTVVELMVTIAIALFLLGGLVTIVQSVRRTYADQQALVQLQDQQRFAITLLTDVIQSGGYYDNPVADTISSALPTFAPLGQGQAFYGTQGAAVPAAGDTIYVRFRTAQNDGIINCSGGSNTAFAPDAVYTNMLYVNANQQLVCQLSVNGGAFSAPVPLVNGVANLAIYYGVKRQIPAADYNVDTYEQANAAANDWLNVSAVRVRVTFVNPLFGAPNQPVTTQPYIVVERVIQVMSRAGDYT